MMLAKNAFLSAVAATLLLGADPRAANAAGPYTESVWSLTIQGAPVTPHSDYVPQAQDVWVSGNGNNTDGWNSGGSLCLGILAEPPYFQLGDEVTLLTTIVEGGIYGVDGVPVPTGSYEAPSYQFGTYAYTMTPGQKFYVIFDAYIVESTLDPSHPFYDLLHKGNTLRFMFTWDHVEGRAIHVIVNWLGVPIGGGAFVYVPFLNEGPMMTNVRLTHVN
jgi:hypothetical protein